MGQGRIACTLRVHCIRLAQCRLCVARQLQASCMYAAGRSGGRTLLFASLFQNMHHGFFVEIGAYDGETGSNTLFLEKHKSWDGLLIEANPLAFVRT